MVDLYTEAKVSPKGQVNERDIKKILTNMLIYISPAALIYLSQVQAVAMNEFNVFGLEDLIPNKYTVGAMVSWLFSTLIDFLRKLSDGTK